jgi:hypothetical protein
MLMSSHTERRDMSLAARRPPDTKAASHAYGACIGAVIADLADKLVPHLLRDATGPADMPSLPDKPFKVSARCV